MRKITASLLLLCLLPAAVPPGAMAQAPAPAAPKPADPPKKKYDPYASPLEVILSYRLWNNPPPAKDFVKETRPDPKTLNYVPLVGKDPERPKPRDPKGVADLRAELEKDMQTNADKGKAVTDKMQADAAADAAAKAPPAPAPKKTARKRRKPVEAAAAR